jgi:hypothetical protein
VIGTGHIGTSIQLDAAKSHEPAKTAPKAHKRRPSTTEATIVREYILARSALGWTQMPLALLSSTRQFFHATVLIVTL